MQIASEVNSAISVSQWKLRRDRGQVSHEIKCSGGYHINVGMSTDVYHIVLLVAKCISGKEGWVCWSIEGY